MKLIYRIRTRNEKKNKTNTTHWTDIVSTIFSVLSFIGVVALIWQIDRVERAIKGETYAKIYDQEFALFHNLLTDTTYYDYFYEGKVTVPGTIQHQKVTVLMAMFADYIEHICLQKENLDKDVKVAWENWIYSMYESTPMLRIHFDDFIDNYSIRCQSMIKKFKTKFQKDISNKKKTAIKTAL